MTSPTEPIEWVVQHECGHAVARWALGSPFRRVLLDSPQGPRVENLLDGQITSGQHILIAACGFIADYQHRGLVMRGSQVAKLLMGGDDDLFEVDDSATGQVAVRPTRVPAVADGGDLQYMARRAVDEHWPADRCIVIWRGCEQFAAACRPAIDAVAAALLDHQELSYAEVSEIARAAMAGQPAPPIPSWVVPLQGGGGPNAYGTGR